MIAFVGPSPSVSLAATETVLVTRLDSKQKRRSLLGTELRMGELHIVVLDIKLGSKLGTGLDGKLCTIIDIKLVSKLGMVLDRELDTKIGPACSLDIKVSPKLGSALDNKLKCCAKVITVIKNIINSFGVEIGAVIVSKLVSILGIALITELGTALRELCTIVDIKLEDNVKLGSKLETILDVEIKLGSKVGIVLDEELCTVAVDTKLGSKLGTVLDRGRRTVVVLDIKLGSKLGSGLDRELGFKVGRDSSLDIKLGT
jgi:hypothetical protein